ncbi:MAG: DNA-packaging protein [Allosphingosinicella sp.]|uniref:DNA-packaging protein n=1 Tax=Allosphingosinicella sp. TaxID=2823234 RepID=UPI00393FF741
MSSPLRPEAFRRLAMLDDAEQARLIGLADPADLLRIDAHYEHWVHQGQVEPKGEGWRTWLMMAGRGYGKTRAGAEWIGRLARRLPGLRIALVGANADEVRKVMVEGESGLLACAGRRPPRWEPSLSQLSWPNGSQAFVYSAETPDALRGPQHHFAWCDELAKWSRAEETWDNLQLGLRLGPRARVLVTTTPRSIPLLAKIRDHPWTVCSGGATGDNISLSANFVAVMTATYGGTRLGRQELEGKIIEDVRGALWTRAGLEAARTAGPPPELRRIVIGVDPPAGADGACGIVVCGLAGDGAGTAYVLGDHSVAGLQPQGWAAAVAAAAEAWGADRVIAEVNQGGAMVESVLKAAGLLLPVSPVHASRGKAARAEPIATFFTRGRARLAGRFPELEDELAGLVCGGGYQGPGRSPDRADAMVWAMTDLLLGRRAEPSVRGFW